MSKPQVKIEIVEISIRETRRGWLNKRTGVYHKTAVLAQRAVNRRAREKAEVIGAVASIVHWEPTTKLGRQIVMTLTKD